MKSLQINVRRKVFFLAAIFAALGLILGIADHAWTLRKEEVYRQAIQKYGYFPSFGWTFDDAASAERGYPCYRVEHLNPPVRWNWRGEMWQEPYFLWEDIRLLSPAPDTVLSHSHAGPVKIGDIVCGWSDIGWSVTVYTIDNHHMGCRSIAVGPAYPPCEKGQPG